MTGRDSTDGNQNISSEQAKEPSLDELTASRIAQILAAIPSPFTSQGPGASPADIWLTPESELKNHVSGRTQGGSQFFPRSTSSAGALPLPPPPTAAPPAAPPEAPPAAPSPAAVPPLPVAAPPVPAAAPPVPAVVEPSHIETGSQSAESSEPRRSAGSLRTRRAKHKAAESQSVDPAQPTAAKQTADQPATDQPTAQQPAARKGGLRSLGPILRSQMRQRRRLALSLIAVTIGVAYLAGSLSLLHRVRSGMADQAGTSNEPADLVVEGSVASTNAVQEVRRLVPDSIIPAIKKVPGVIAVEPRLENLSTILLSSTGRPLVTLGLTTRPLGTNFPASEELNPYEFVGQGSGPVGPEQVVIDEVSAAKARVSVGETIRITAKASVSSYEVVGIVRPKRGAIPAGTSLAMFDLPSARVLFNAPVDDNAIAIKISDGTDRAAVAQAIDLILPPLAEVSTAQQYSAHREVNLEKSLAMVRYLLLGFAVLALIVSAFTVSNSLSLLFERRRTEFALLRLLGANQQQLVTGAALEAALGGLIAGAVGLVVGLGIGWAIEIALRSFDSPVPVSGAPITWWIPLLSVATGIAITVITAMQPARRAADVAPISAVTASDRLAGTSRKNPVGSRLLAGLALLIGVGGLGWILGGVIGVISAATVLAIVAITLVLLPPVLGSVVSRVARLLVFRPPMLRRLNESSSASSRRRVASTTAGLLLAVTVVSALVTLGSSFSASFNGGVQQAITADLVVDSATFTNGGLSAGLIPKLREIPGVTAVCGWKVGTLSVDGRTMNRAAGLDESTIFQVLSLDTVNPPPARLGQDGIALSEIAAAGIDANEGDQIPVLFENGSTSLLTVRAIYRSELRTLLGDGIVDSSVMSEKLPTSVDVLAFVNVGGKNPAATKRAISRVAASYGTTHVVKPENLLSSRADLLGGFGRVIQWMMLFTVLLAVVGVANTLQLSINDRRREIGLLRTVGATRGQVARMVLAEALALSLVGTFAGMMIGAGLAWGATKALASFGFSTFRLPVVSLAQIALVALLLGLVGAAAPLWRIVRQPSLEIAADASSAPQRFRSRRKRIPRSSTPDPANLEQNVVHNDQVAARGDGVDSVSQTVMNSTASALPALADTSSGGDQQTDEHLLDRVAMRCYNCGFNAQHASTCANCGAALQVLPRIEFPFGVEELRAATAAYSEQLLVEKSVPENLDGEFSEVSASTEATESTVVDLTADLSAHMATPGPSAGDLTPPIPSVMIEDAILVPEVEDAILVPEVEEPEAKTAETATTATAAETAETDTPEGPDGSQPAPRSQQPGIDFRKLDSKFSATPSSQPQSTGPDDAGPRRFGDHAEPPRTFASRRDARERSPFKKSPEVPVDALQVDAQGGTLTGVFSQSPGRPGERPDDPFGLELAKSRLCPASLRLGASGLRLIAALLREGELVHHVVVGSSLSLPSCAAVTDRRILVTISERLDAAVEIFEFSEDLVVHGRHMAGFASITLTNDADALTIDRILDVSEAVAMARKIRTLNGPIAF